MILGTTGLCAGPNVGDHIYALAREGSALSLSYSVPVAGASAAISHVLSARRKMTVGAVPREVRAASVGEVVLPPQSSNQLEV